MRAEAGPTTGTRSSFTTVSKRRRKGMFASCGVGGVRHGASDREGGAEGAPPRSRAPSGSASST